LRESEESIFCFVGFEKMNNIIVIFKKRMDDILELQFGFASFFFNNNIKELGSLQKESFSSGTWVGRARGGSRAKNVRGRGMYNVM